MGTITQRPEFVGNCVVKVQLSFHDQGWPVSDDQWQQFFETHRAQQPAESS